MKKVRPFILFCTVTAFATLSYADTTNVKHKHKYHKKTHHSQYSAASTPPRNEKIYVPDTEKLSPLPEPPSPLTGQFTITSNYVFRGISQTSNLPAFQGSLTYTFLKPGIYFNLWGSNVNFLAPNGDQATVEIDTIAGIKNNIITDNISYDVAFARYNYPKAAASYNELLATLAYKILFFKYAFSSNAYNYHADSHYYAVGINYNIPPKHVFNFNNVNLTASIGHYALPIVAGSTYNDYLIQLTKKIAGVYSVALAWTGTDGRSNTGTLGDDHWVVSVIVDV